MQSGMRFLAADIRRFGRPCSPPRTRKSYRPCTWSGGELAGPSVWGRWEVRPSGLPVRLGCACGQTQVCDLCNTSNFSVPGSCWHRAFVNSEHGWNLNGNALGIELTFYTSHVDRSTREGCVGISNETCLFYHRSSVECLP